MASFCQMARVGVEPTNIRLSTQSLCQFAYRAFDWRQIPSRDLRARELNPASELMKLRRAPARPQLFLGGEGVEPFVFRLTV
jgi:hypothetical protein